VLLPWNWHAWFIAVVTVLSLAALLSRIAIGFLLWRLLLLSPFVFGVVLVNALHASVHGSWLALAARSGICLFTVVLLANTTTFAKILSALRSARVPALLVTTLALMHRYLFVLLDESERMRRARASRTFQRQHRMRWHLLGTVVGQLFVRASERAERIYAAMCARGWK
jgi:cobalt/nickel transport system permease protein